MVWIVVIAEALGACNLPSAGESGAAAIPSAAASAEAQCSAAPEAVRGRIERGLTVRGATVARAFASPATDVVNAADAQGTPIESGWFVAGLINGVGQRPEVGAWFVTTLEANGGTVLAANPSALRYWDGAGGADIDGSGRQVAIHCVGPPPEP